MTPEDSNSYREAVVIFFLTTFNNANFLRSLKTKLIILAIGGRDDSPQLIKFMVDWTGRYA